ncbi:DEAD/DEAH box helicase family protein [Mucilaginibacter polytrichastri]|uniref:Uncharacterized protein n=1 Tax=Mucilaginibacter polytrichastri TaxID=1302689 RepID=A0A1Q6A3X7_9SPHI|nr:hypothetical protein [Mucilaginibacter polytrichastri]OKS88706.1 hypothetical protein RG47T_4184 [Mucilaginibacter polytrichastri]SFT04662.1 hypothetical protein SAMN04487890_10938 [Mucilaginibacter polytrichastri]
MTANEYISQNATVKIKCNGVTGTALLYFPSDEVEYMYVFTAKHCLAGEDFDKTFVPSDIKLEKLFNAATFEFHEFQLSDTDVVVCSPENELDIALLVLPKTKIVNLIGKSFFYECIESAEKSDQGSLRGFADFNQGDEDRPFEANFIENIKDKPLLFIADAVDPLDTYLQKALDNVSGLSGSGYFLNINNVQLLYGIIHTYEEKNHFIGTKIAALNRLIPPGYMPIPTVQPEKNADVIASYQIAGQFKESLYRKTKDTVAEITIKRDTKQALENLQIHKIAVLHGFPGVGKSAAAKAIISELEKDGKATVLAFAADLLQSNTFNETLLKAGYKSQLNDLLNSQLAGKKVIIWIESFEKLVELGADDAFMDLLFLQKNNPQIQIVVTIREYLLQKFKVTYHYELPRADIYTRVNEFTEDEFNIIKERLPEMTPLFSNHKLTRLLRTPYYLDKAVRIFPQLNNVEDIDEITFKKLMWQYIIEAGDVRRGLVFQSISLKRALELTLFTDTSQPADLVEALVKDNILQVEAGELANRFAPSHDILEDWALIRVIKLLRQKSESPIKFIESLGNSPAIRRAFRLWLEELYKYESDDANEFTNTLLSDPNAPTAWKDELIISILRSSYAGALFQQVETQLLANEGDLVQHYINLLQAACKTLNNANSNFDDNFPVGSGWDTMIVFLASHVTEIKDDPALMMKAVFVIQSWGKQLPAFAPNKLPRSAGSASSLLKVFLEKYYELLDHPRRNHASESLEFKIIRLLFSLTKDNLDATREIVEAALALPKTETGFWVNQSLLRDIRYYLIDGVVSDQICRFFPDTVLEIAQEEWREKEKVHRPGSLMSMIKPEKGPDYYGLDENIEYHYGMASGYQTFFYWMFLHHPDKAIKFLIPFLNKAFAKNQEGRFRTDEDRQLITATIDQEEKVYFGSFRYWSMYAGRYGDNRVIQSLLMALENGLFDLAAKGVNSYVQCRKIIAELISQSNNVAVLGVVSSIIQAYPNLLDEASVKLFGVREFFEWDSTRHNSDLLNLDYYNDDKFLVEERKVASKRKHRTSFYRGMIQFVADYMFYIQTYNQLLFAEIDKMWEVARPDDVIWRKALYDMDSRKYSFKPVALPGYENYVAYTPEYDEGVSEMVEDYKNSVGLFPIFGGVWASEVYNGPLKETHTYENWKLGFDFLQLPKNGNSFMSSPGVFAAIGLKTFYDTLSQEEKEWCFVHVKAGAEKTLIKRDFMDIDLNIYDQNPVLYAVPFLLKKQMTKKEEIEIKALIFKLLIARFDGTAKAHFLLGISINLWKIAPSFALSCWYGLLEYIELERANNSKRAFGYLDEEWDLDSHFIPEVKPIDNESWKEELILTVAKQKNKHIIPDIFTLEISTHWQFDWSLQMISPNNSLPEVHKFISNTKKMHLDFIADLKLREKDDFSESRSAFKQFYARFILSQPDITAKALFKELLNETLIEDDTLNIKAKNNYVRELIQQHISSINNWYNDDQPIERFWILWSEMRDFIISTLKPFLLRLFLLDIDWTEASSEWHVLNGKKGFYGEFITLYGFNDINSSFKFISGVGMKNFMPDSIAWTASMLMSDKAPIAKTKLLEKFIERAFYNFGKQIKSSKKNLEDFLFILDLLIKRESTKAYMIKEELLQYR